MISLESILAAVPRFVPHAHFARGKQLKLEDMGPGMALDVSHERPQPSRPVENTWQKGLAWLIFIQAIAAINQSDQFRDGDHITPLQRLLVSGEHLVHNVVGVARGKKGELYTSEPSPVDQHAAEAQKPSVLVLLGTVVHLQPQCVRSPILGMAISLEWM